MKKLSYLLLFLLSVITYGCAETEQPYVGYITIDDAVVPAAGGAATLAVNTDISSDIALEVAGTATDWCTVTSKGKEITVTTTANTGIDSRKATVNVRCGYREFSFTVTQQYEGQEYEYDWSDWTATGSDVHESDGGGYPSLFNANQTTYWHSYYGEPTPCPHWLLIDMKKELSIAKVRIARRFYPGNGNYYPSVKVLEVYTSTDNENFTKVGGFTFALPWTAPDGTVVTGNSPKVPAFEEVVFAQDVTTRYVKLVITETNNTSGACQVAYFKAYKQNW